MPALTAAQLRAAVEGATQRDCAADGRELRTSTTDWDLAADELHGLSDETFYSQDLCDCVCGAWVETGEDTGRTDWDHALAALMDACEQRREERDALEPGRLGVNFGSEE